MPKPVFVMAPGAWHGPESFSPVTKFLTKHGYIVETVSLASVGSSVPRAGFEEDVGIITTAIEHHADMGSDIVLVMHSYGGIPGSSACRGLLKKEPNGSGKTGGVVRLVYIAAFAVNEGVCLMDGLGGRPMPWWRFDDEKASMTVENPIPTFYNDIADEGTLNDLVSGLKPQTYSSFWGKATYAPWLEISATYILCRADNALPFEAQQDMVANARKHIENFGREGVRIDTATLETSHTPLVSQPEQVARILRRSAGEEL